MTALNRFLFSLSLLMALPSGAESLESRYTAAIQEAREAHALRMEHLQRMYHNHLDRLIAAAQPRGDIESIVLFLDEKETLGSGGNHPELNSARQSLTAQQTRLETQFREDVLRIEQRYGEALEAEIASLTRAGRLEEAMALSQTLAGVRERQEALRPREEEEPAEPEGPRLGDNIFPRGNMEDDGRWRISNLGGRNRTGFHSESRHETGGPARNQTIRFEMHERRGAHASHPVQLRDGQEYQITWRARQLRPWRQGIELRGKGHYMVGFQIGDRRWRTFTPEQQLAIRRQRRKQITPPDTTEWQTYTRTVLAGPHMDEFFISVSPGEGDFLIDDVEIRPILGD